MLNTCKSFPKTFRILRKTPRNHVPLSTSTLEKSRLENSTSTQISITDPFVLYQNYVAQGLLEKDEYQLRVMKEFQKLYQRVVDYKPPEELSIKISLLLRKIELKQVQAMINERENKGLKLLTVPFGSLTRLFKRDAETQKNQVIRIITDEEELSNFNSPQGLLINGEVGCGKSMLMDLFAASLPHHLKMRWHFNNFVLWVYNEIHKIQNEKIVTSTLHHGKRVKFSMENEFILFEIAQKMINKNTILMLDEFMLPDIATANIIKILFTYYFKLGGVLVATSNKLPEELYSNEFHKSKFKNFVNILNYRCKSVEMRSTKDYRELFALKSQGSPNSVVMYNNPDHEGQWRRLIKGRLLDLPNTSPLMDDTIPIRHPDLKGKPGSFKVYNRVTHLPLTFKDQICYLDFDHICKGLYGSSDYITLASNYHTIVLANVPILTTKMKNEARRFITLLDAIYESKCQFYIKSTVPIDYIFFPDADESDAPEEIKDMARNSDNNNLEVQDEEMFAKTAIATSSPYRPNTATYDQNHTSEYKESVVNDYKDLKAFTGEDEKFAFKRAVLRIKEMVGSDIWRETDRWVPIAETMRPWEDDTSSFVYKKQIPPEDEKVNETIDRLLKDKTRLSQSLPRDISEAENIPFRQFNQKFAPIFTNVQHFWTMGKWGNMTRLKDGIVKSWINSSRNGDN